MVGVIRFSFFWPEGGILKGKIYPLMYNPLGPKEQKALYNPPFNTMLSYGHLTVSYIQFSVKPPLPQKRCITPWGYLQAFRVCKG